MALDKGEGANLDEFGWSQQSLPFVEAAGKNRPSFGTDTNDKNGKQWQARQGG